MNHISVQDASRELRADIIEMIYLAKDGHPGPCFSAVDIIAALYFGGVLNVDPQRPDWEDRDRFVLSKGHACPALYAALSRRGFFPLEELKTLRAVNSRLQGHPDMKKTPGVDAVTGALGNGLSMGLGLAIGLRKQGKDGKVYALVGDGEFQEGVIWETLMAAKHHKAGNLIVLMDHNGFQSGGTIEELSGLEPILPKIEAFGWHCSEADGHDHEEILKRIGDAQNDPRPSFILCKTKKGKGLPFMEGDNSWHKKVPSQAQYEQAMSLLRKEQ